jgi:hypothetical protein
MLREISQIQKDKYHMFSLKYGIWKQIISMTIKMGLFTKRKQIRERHKGVK